jgi:hypothetical protein
VVNVPSGLLFGHEEQDPDICSKLMLGGLYVKLVKPDVKK